MLIDKFLPQFDAVESHTTIVRAPADRVWAAIRTTDFGESPVVRALLAARAVPAMLAAPRAALSRVRDPSRAPVTLDDAFAHGFVLLAEQPNRELLLGVAGRFWSPNGGVCRVDPVTFTRFQEPGAAQAAWNFTIRPLVGNKTMLTTETRVRCTDERGRFRFRLYWVVVRPFSGLLRLMMLRTIKHAAEVQMSPGPQATVTAGA
jgi:hypothetical protein